MPSLIMTMILMQTKQKLNFKTRTWKDSLSTLNGARNLEILMTQEDLKEIEMTEEDATEMILHASIATEEDILLETVRAEEDRDLETEETEIEGEEVGHQGEKDLTDAKDLEGQVDLVIVNLDQMRITQKEEGVVDMIEIEEIEVMTESINPTEIEMTIEAVGIETGKIGEMIEGVEI